jgi:hypothetical protein
MPKIQASYDVYEYPNIRWTAVIYPDRMTVIHRMNMRSLSRNNMEYSLFIWTLKN